MLHSYLRATLTKIRNSCKKQAGRRTENLENSGKPGKMEELQNLSAEELRAVIAMVKNRHNLGGME